MRSIRKYLIAVFLTFLVIPGVFQPSNAQEEWLRFDRITILDGLSQNTVYTILQDRLGYMWFGTADGLNRYDGYSFTIFRRHQEEPYNLADNTVLSLFEDSRGTIWVGTESGLDRFDHRAQHFVHLAGLDAGPVVTIAEDLEGRLWIGTRSNGLWVMDIDSGNLNQYRHDSQDPGSLVSDSIYQVLVTRAGEVWVATDDGLEHFISSEGSFKHYRPARNEPNSPTSSRVRTLLEDSSGALWVGTDGGGLNHLDPESGLFTFYLNSPVDPESLGDNRVWDLLEDHSGTLWVATPTGLDRFNRQTRRFAHFRHSAIESDSLSGSHPLTLFEDRSGAIWIGTQGAGLSRYRPAAHRFRLFRSDPSSYNGLVSNVIQAILEDSHGFLWIGTPESTLSRLERETGLWTHYRHDSQDVHSLTAGGITSLAEDHNRRIWVGTFGGGLDELNPNTGYFTHHRYAYGSQESLRSNNIADLVVTRDGDLWVATADAGLSRLDERTGNFQHFRHEPGNPTSLSSDQITTLFEDGQGVLWIGSYDAGLSRFEPVDGGFRHYRWEPDQLRSLSSNQVFSLTEYPPGVLWVGTKEGLNRFDVASETFTHFTTREGLPSNVVNCLVADNEGSLWIGTTNGLARFDPYSQTFRAFTIEDGLQSEEFLTSSCFKSQRGELFFGGVQGFNSFYPIETSASKVPPPVVITTVKKNNQVVPGDFSTDAVLQLSFRDDAISFEFAALDYNSTGQNRYTYKLEGFEGDWIEAGEHRLASYTNLRAGDYIFRVRAANRDGVWNEAGASLAIHITPAVWETGWFRIASVLLLASGVVIGFRYRTRDIRNRNLALERKIAELSKQVEEAAVASERNRLARDLHDSVAQSLYSLTLLSEAGIRNFEAGQLAESRNALQRLGEIGQQALQEMRLMVYQLRQPVLEQTTLPEAVEHRLEAVERRAGLQARLIVHGTPKLSPVLEQELYYLAQEALNNALKHAGAISVLVQLAETPDGLSLEVRDNGRGFEPSQLSRGGFGLQSMRERAERLGGDLEIHSTPGGGTRVTFLLPTLPKS